MPSKKKKGKKKEEEEKKKKMMMMMMMMISWSSPVDTLCHQCSDVSTSCPGLCANEVTAVFQAYIFNWIFFQGGGKGVSSLREYNVTDVCLFLVFMKLCYLTK